ncbi:MAG: bifunctional ADP-heptose synthase [Bacteroidota bacterium]
MKTFLEDCRSRQIMVIGDLMLDRYLWGKVERISPEAPVPVVDVYQEENRLGGAANVALNIHGMGAKPLLCGIVGEDVEGEALRTLAQQQGWATELILPSKERRTTVKVRVIGNQQQVLRVDKEDRHVLPEPNSRQLLDQVRECLPQCDAVVLQDYDKGLLATSLIQDLILLTNKHDIPILVDPKFRHFWAYEGCTLFKPNLKELKEGLGMNLRADNLPQLERAARQLRKRMPHRHTLITLGAGGMLWINPDETADYTPGHPRSVADVSGAGDTVIAMTALGMSVGLSPRQTAHYANLAGGLVCESVGVVPITPDLLRSHA